MGNVSTPVPHSNKNTIFLLTFEHKHTQGAKAAMKRERNAGKGGKGGDKSQLKVNEKAKSIICQTCRATFLVTARAKVCLRWIVGMDVIEFNL